MGLWRKGARDSLMDSKGEEGEDAREQSSEEGWFYIVMTQRLSSTTLDLKQTSSAAQAAPSPFPWQIIFLEATDADPPFARKRRGQQPFLSPFFHINMVSSHPLTRRITTHSHDVQGMTASS